MSCGSIYKIPFPNGKNYIGLTTTSLEKRKREHKKCAKSRSNQCLYNAIRKYDMVDNFELIEIDTADTTDELCEKEIQYIQEYNSYYMNGNGYNMTYGGEGTSGYVFTEEDRQRTSKRSKKQFENPEARQQASERSKKQFENPEARQQASERSKKHYEDNPEARQQMSERIKTYYEDNPEARQQASERSKKYFENPEARIKHSEIKKKYFEDNPDAGTEHSERLKKYYENNPEARQQASEIKKTYYEDNPEARRKLSDGKGKNKPFDIFTMEGTFIKTFAYQFEAREYLQKEHHITSTISMSEVLSGKRKSSAGLVFKYK